MRAMVARWLRPIRFEDRELERQFQVHDCSSTIPLARFCYASAIFIWAGFGILDAAVGGDKTRSLWSIRFMVGEPTILMALAITLIRRLWPHLKLVGLTVTFVLGSCVIWMMLVLDPPVSQTYYVGIILVLFPAYVFAQVRLPHAMAATFILVMAYHRLILSDETTHASTAATDLTFMITTAYIGLVACFLLEWARRREFAQLREIARTNEELQHLSSHDELTRLLNRRHLEPALETAIGDFRRSGRPSAIMMIDLDDFKQVNDALGHGTGDRVLIEAACCITESIRPADSAYRIGGDEFVVLLPAATISRAAAVASEIKAAFAVRSRSLVKDHGLAVGMSIGVTQVRAGIETPSELLRLADGALYQAKLRGKGRVHAAQEPPRGQVGDPTAAQLG